MSDWTAWQRKWELRGMSVIETARLIEAGHSSAIEGAKMDEPTMDRVAARIMIHRRAAETGSVIYNEDAAVDKLLGLLDEESL